MDIITPHETKITEDPALRGVLPRSFLFGAATAAYQVEGGADVDGKGPNVWDAYLKHHADNGTRAVGSYWHWREDVALLRRYGMTTYRFSIAWSRVIPTGRREQGVNEEGLRYYDQLVDSLVEAGITPFVTLFHWDTPLGIDKAYGGFGNVEAVVRDFVLFADLLFSRFGDRVKYWITLNEPRIHTMLTGVYMRSPGWTDAQFATYTRSFILCHATAARLYHEKYQPSQGGQIGITLDCDWVEPLDDSPAAKSAAQASIDCILGLFADPLFKGRFPTSVLDRFGDEQLAFTDEQWGVIKGSLDFLGLNHYGTSYSTGRLLPPSTPLSVSAFGLQEKTTIKDGQPIGNRGENGHPFDVPWGFRKLLRYIHETYTGAGQVPLFITENGFPVDGESNLPLDVRLHGPECDGQRQAYFTGYIREMALAVRDDGIRIDGYMAWSLLDNLEWVMGFGTRLGITAVDRDSPEFTRYPKDSAYMLGRIFRYLVAQ